MRPFKIEQQYFHLVIKLFYCCTKLNSCFSSSSQTPRSVHLQIYRPSLLARSKWARPIETRSVTSKNSKFYEIMRLAYSERTPVCCSWWPLNPCKNLTEISARFVLSPRFRRDKRDLAETRWQRSRRDRVNPDEISARFVMSLRSRCYYLLNNHLFLSLFSIHLLMGDFTY